MIIIRNSKPLLVLGGLVSTAALLIGLQQAQAQAPQPGAPLSGAGSFPQSFIVPGTNTSLHVGGQIQMDLQYNFDSFGTSSSVGAYDNLAAASTELEGPGVVPGGPHTNSHVLRFTADNSKLFTETRTPSAYGEVKTYLEFDFQGGQAAFAGPNAAGSTTIKSNDDGIPRLRMAYGTLGPWLLGKAESNFVDLAALPDTLFGFGQAGAFDAVGTYRQTQIRYTWLLPDGISAAGSIESAMSGGTFMVTPGVANLNWNDFNAPGISQSVPAATGTVRMDQPWGHAKLGLAVMQERFDSNGAAFAGLPGGTHFKRWGYQIQASGHLNTFGKDQAQWELGYGQGAAQYSGPLELAQLGGNWEEGLVCGATVISAAPKSFACSQPRVLGGYLGYTHFWNDQWRSGITAGYDQESRPNGAGLFTSPAALGGVSTANGNVNLAGLEHRHYSAGASLFWTPVAGVQFGSSFFWYRREVWSGARGTAERLMTQALFRF